MITCRIKGFIQPFERKLALEELRAQAGCDVVPLDGDEETALTFFLTESSKAESLRESLAYWCSIGDDIDGLTAQIRCEATSLIARASIGNDSLVENLPSMIHSSLPNKRCLRYATHGMHEYRGKFFPQLVRALINIVDLGNNAVILDPMCGSGTTLVEARLSGKNCYGLDMNPLSAYISKVKCEALSLKPSDLVAALDALREALDGQLKPGSGCSAFLSPNDLNYMKRWFDPRALHELDRIRAAIHRLQSTKLQNFYLVCLSNILRGVSWQKNDDLRVRREAPELMPGETTNRFLSEAMRSTRVVSAFLAERGSVCTHGHVVRRADARSATEVLPELVGKVDAVITSPPYATALPYIDTDRLNLIYLGLLRRDRHRALEMEMIGNREVTTRGRVQYWKLYEENKTLLPEPTRLLVERIDQLNKSVEVGFRRRNLSALLSKYFLDMREAINQSYLLLRPGGTAFLVIGNNRTTAGGEQVEIRTADHLGKIAENVGFQMVDRLPMDMLASRDIFRNNAMPSEQILRLVKPQ